MPDEAHGLMQQQMEQVVGSCSDFFFNTKTKTDDGLRATPGGSRRLICGFGLKGQRAGAAGPDLSHGGDHRPAGWRTRLLLAVIVAAPGGGL